MVDAQLLTPEVSEEIKKFKKTDILIGIPSFNNAQTIGHVAQVVCAGLDIYFPDEYCVVVNSDGGSKDGTIDRFREAETGSSATLSVQHALHPAHRISTGYIGVPGKGSAFRTIFRIAEELQAKACAVVDSDLRSITPEWIKLLIEPVYAHGFDYVSPLYLRHKFDGTITNGIIFPLTRTLYGKKIRQPIGGEFGFSGKLASHYLTKKVWDSDVARFGIDIWMTTTALAEGFRICQSYLGAKIHDPKDPGSDLTGMFVQVVGSVFDMMELYSPVWSKIETNEEVPLFGTPAPVGLESVNVNIERMVNGFRQGVKDLMPIWVKVLGEESRAQLEKLAESNISDFHLSDDLWVKLIYEYCIGFHGRVMVKEHLMRSLIPLYLGRTASFIIENEESSAEEVEEKIESLCMKFESMKSFLLEGWKK